MIESKEKPLFKDKVMWLSMGASCFCFLMHFLFSFFLTPYLIKHIGKAEYSFFPLASSFISYITIMTVALNSMAGRFVTIALHQQKNKEANEYFNAVFFSSLIFSLIMLPIGGFFIFQINYFLNVPDELVFNVKVLFSMVLTCFLIGQMGNVFSIATFYKDRLYLSSIANVTGNLIKLISAFLLFSFLKPKIFYVGIMDFCVLLTSLSFNYYYTRSYMPQMYICSKYFQLSCVWDLLSSGIWNSISQLSNVLLGGLDLVIANRYLGTEAVALIAVSKTAPHQVLAILATIGKVFNPRYTRQFAQGNKDALVESLRSSMRLLAILSCCPMGFLLAKGYSFYHLWVPQMDSFILQILSIIGMGVLLISITTQPVYGIFIITNKVKLNSLVVLGTGILNVLCVIICLQFAESQMSKILVIVSTSTIIGIFRNLFFTLPYSAYCLQISKFIFYKSVFLGLGLFAMTTSVYWLTGKFILMNDWPKLICGGFIGTLFNVIILWTLALTKQEKEEFVHVFKSRLKIEK